MLHKSHISNIEIYSEEWHSLRIGRFTSSKIHCLMAEKPLTSGAMTYINHKAGEYITGHSTTTEEDSIEDENTAWGLQYETEALQNFGRLKGLKYLVVQKLISDPASRFSSTPDALWVLGSSVTKEDYYNVASVEVKCPRKYPRFFPLYACNTPQDLRKEVSSYYWQVLDQMDNCNASIGYFVCYHPLFPVGKNIKIIEFVKINLWDDFKLLQQRKQLALAKFNEIVADFIPQKV